MSAAVDIGSAPPAAARRLRVLFGAAVGSVLTSYLSMEVVAALAGATASVRPAPVEVLTAGIPLWLAAHQVPLTLTGAPFGVLPLLPTAGVVVLAANFAAAAIGKLGGRWGGEAAWVVATLAAAHASLAVLGTALPTEPAHAEPWPALLGAGLVGAGGAGLGVLREVGSPAWWPAAPSWLRAGLTSASTGAVALFAAGALMLFARLMAAAGTVRDGFAVWPGLGAGIGVIVLSVCYLPNALVAVVSWLAGPGVVIGAAVASPLTVSVGPLPPIPLLAAMPTSQPPGWVAAVFVLPVTAGVLVGLGCRRSEDDPMVRLRAVAVAVAAVAVGFAIAASVVSGRLASGPSDPVELPALSGALALLGWLGVPAMVAALVPVGVGWSRRRTAVPGLPELNDGKPEAKRSAVDVGGPETLGGLGTDASGPAGAGGSGTDAGDQTDAG